MNRATRILAWMGYVEEMSPDELCHIKARNQHRVITRKQALDACLHPRAIGRRLASGDWQRLLPRTYFVARESVPWKAKVMAGCLWGPPGSVASGQTAAALYGFMPETLPIHIASESRRSSIEEVRVSTVGDLPKRGRIFVDDIPVLSVEGTLLTLAPGLSDRSLEEALSRAVRLGRTDPGRLARALDSPRVPRTGTTRLRKLMERRFAFGVTDSAAEDLFITRIGRVVPGFVHHFVVSEGRTAELDFAYLPEKVAVEVDGAAFHSDAIMVQRDKQRDAWLSALGWQVLRFTYWDLMHRSDEVARTLKAVLDSRRNRLSL